MIRTGKSMCIQPKICAFGFSLKLCAPFKINDDIVIGLFYLCKEFIDHILNWVCVRKAKFCWFTLKTFSSDISVLVLWIWLDNIKNKLRWSINDLERTRQALTELNLISNRLYMRAQNFLRLWGQVWTIKVTLEFGSCGYYIKEQLWTLSLTSTRF
jgi:hypothetical protein